MQFFPYEDPRTWERVATGLAGAERWGKGNSD